MDKDFITCCSSRGFCAKGCGRQDKQLNTYDYLAGIPGNENPEDLVEVQFKHTRKGYYRNDNHLPLEKGDMVAVEASPGHDIGVITLTGKLVPLQMKKANLKPGVEIKRVYRKARPADLEKYEESKALEQDTMIRSRKIAQDLNLNMKIGDVEYQGDGNKAIFYYIADARVDFRQLIKVLAEAFHVRIEMKQIGARQEAGRIGGIGPCGRELCCATWMKNFNSVSTTAARFQDISPNPQKLAGQCAKLKCCLNYEVDTYVEASKKIPQRDVTLETADATYYLFKTDILAGLVTYSTDRRMAANLVTITADRAQKIIEMNRAGEKPQALDETTLAEPERPVDLVEQEDLHRFDKSKRRNKNANNKRRGQGGEGKREAKSAEGQTAKANGNRDNQPKDNAQREGAKERKPKDAPRKDEKGAVSAEETAGNSMKESNRPKATERPQGAPNAGGQKPGTPMTENGKQKEDNRPQNVSPVPKEGRPLLENKSADSRRPQNNEGRPQGSNATPKEGRQPSDNRNDKNAGNRRPQNSDNRPQGSNPAPKEGRPLLENKNGGNRRPQNSENRPQGSNAAPKEGRQPSDNRNDKNTGNRRPQNNENRPQGGNPVPKEGRPLLENKGADNRRPQDNDNRPQGAAPAQRPRRAMDENQPQGGKPQGGNRPPKGNGTPKEGRPLLENKAPNGGKPQGDHRPKPQATAPAQERAPKEEGRRPDAERPRTEEKPRTENPNKNEHKQQDAEA